MDGREDVSGCKALVDAMSSLHRAAEAFQKAGNLRAAAFTKARLDEMRLEVRFHMERLQPSTSTTTTSAAEFGAARQRMRGL